MSDTKISDALVKIANEAQQDFFDAHKLSEFFCSGHYHEESMRAALEAAIPHLHPKPAELAEQQGVDFDIDDVRELFEQWAKGRNLTPDTWGVSAYVCPYVDNDFDVWRAAWKALAATGKQQVGEDCTAILSARIAFEVELCGSLQRAAKELGIDVGYLSRLARGEKTNPSDEVLEKFGLERTVTYTAIKREYVASPLHPRTKSA